MLVALILLEVVTLALVVFLLIRRGAPQAASTADPRLEALIAADLPGVVARAQAATDARLAALDGHLRAELTQLRTDARGDAQASREAADRAAASLRTEVQASIQALGGTLRTGLDGLRADSHKDAEQLRAVVEGRLDKMSETNAAKLEQMRQTVDEKLHATLQTRLTESFGQVTDQLTKVHAGLGEMNTLSTGVQDLNRLFSNVKSRGGFAEVQLGSLLEQVLAPGQYVQNAHVKKGSQEVVEYAVRFPGNAGEDVLLPIDAKFPKEDWERLETAYDAGVAEPIEAARAAFERAIRTQARKICEKYINEPVTTPYAIMFLPTENLYAEVLRRDGLQSDLHHSCKVMVAGPSNLYALLSSFQLGFRMINLQKKGNEVWTVLGEAKTEFGKFGTLMDKMEKKVGEVQGTLHDLGTRSRAINRKLRDVSEVDVELGKALPIDTMLPMLAAEEE
jgi:DNA recombination protein RmuC